MPHQRPGGDSSSRPYTIGLTGSIASGKSTVRRMLEELGAQGIDADALVHALMAPGQPAHEAILRAFGSEVLDSEGRVDRRLLGRWVFSRPEELARLEAILHPAVRRRVSGLLREATAPVVVVEAVKLVESGMHRGLDALWVVVAGQEEQARRLAERGLKAEEIRVRLAAQPPAEQKLRQADVIIDSSGSLEETRRQVEAAWQRVPVGES